MKKDTMCRTRAKAHIPMMELQNTYRNLIRNKENLKLGFFVHKRTLEGQNDY